MKEWKHELGDLVMAEDKGARHGISIGYIISVERLTTAKNSVITLYTVQWDHATEDSGEIEEYSPEQIKIYKDVLKEYKARMVER